MFEVLLHSRAQRFYDQLDAKRKRQVSRGIEQLRKDPMGSLQVAPLRGELAGLYRLRVGEYRIVYEVRANEHVVFVLAIGPRGDIYK